MATSLSNMLIVTSSKITYPLSHPNFPIISPFSTPPLTRNQIVPIKSVIRDNSYSYSPTNNREKDNNIISNKNDDNNVVVKYNNYSQLPKNWREIQGENNWAGLLEPMDYLLKSEVIRYGEMAQACYDAFDDDLYSKYYGTCRFPREKLFSSLEMNTGYDVKCYLHVTSKAWLKWLQDKHHPRYPREYGDVNWAGYVAVSDDATTRRLGRRDITVAWRGSVTWHEFVDDAKFLPASASSHGIPSPDHGIMVESGFLEMYTDKDESDSYCKNSGREQVLSEVKRLLDMYSNEEVSITITGHSLGSALAVLNAYDIAESGVNIVKGGKKVPVTVMSFSGPMVGNWKFKDRLEKLGVKVLRVVNKHDRVPTSPPFPSYKHVGVELVLDHKNSPYINPNVSSRICSHNLEVLLHVLDGYNGKDNKFVTPSRRDPALVNKGGDYLKDVCMIPPEWWQYEKKGLVKGKDGRWRQPERPMLDADQPQDVHYHLSLLGLVSSHDQDRDITDYE